MGAKKAKNRSGILLVVLFLLLLTAGGALLFLLPQREFSENENRVLTTLPTPTAETVADGSFQEKFEEFTADQFPGRDGFTAVGSVFKYLLGRRDIGGAYVGSDEGGARLYEKNDRQSMENAENTLLLMKAFAARMTSEDRKTVFLPVPSSGTVYKEGLPPFAQVFDAEALLSLAERTLKGSGCVTVDLLPGLFERKDAENLYYRTDHHWTAQGAAAAYAPCCGALGKTPLPDEQVRAYEKLSDSFSGTLASKVLLPFVGSDTVYKPAADMSSVTVSVGSGFQGETLRPGVLYAGENLEKKDKYRYFLGGNYGIVLLEREDLPEDAGTLLIVKDSYANCFVPYMTAHYRRVVMIDPRYYRGKLADALAAYNPDAVLFLYESGNFAGDKSLPYLLKGAVGNG